MHRDEFDERRRATIRIATDWNRSERKRNVMAETGQDSNRKCVVMKRKGEVVRGMDAEKKGEEGNGQALSS